MIMFLNKVRIPDLQQMMNQRGLPRSILENV